MPMRLTFGLQAASVLLVAGLLGLLIWKVVHDDKGVKLGGRAPVVKLAAALLLALVLAAPAAASERHPTLGELEGEVMCPTCKTTLDQSNAPIADRIRQFISARIAAGDTKSEIKRKLVLQFGPAVLAEPSKKGFNLLAWVLPFVGLGVGAAVLAWLVWRWSRARPETPARVGPPLDPELEHRVDEELARFDG